MASPARASEADVRRSFSPTGQEFTTTTTTTTTTPEYRHDNVLQSTLPQFLFTAAAETPTPPPLSLPLPPLTSWLVEGDSIEPADSDELGDDGDESDLASVTSSVYAHTYERGRRYQSFENSLYPIPNDSLEQSREDQKHIMLMELTNGDLFLAPAGKNPQKIVDIGTGTGIWAIQAGDAYPGASVIGTDKTLIQPIWVPPNVEFMIDDCEKDWLMHNIDLAHFRFMAMVLKNVPLVLQHAYDNLRPGGWIEFQELLGQPFCDDDTMRHDDAFKVLYDLAGQGYKRLDMSTTLPAELKPLLQEAGFINVTCQIIHAPIGPWAKAKRMRLIGLYQRTAVLDFIPTLAGRPFEALGMPDDEAQMRLTLAREALDDVRVHRYFKYYYWYAQKPGSYLSGETGEDEGLGGDDDDDDDDDDDMRNDGETDW